MDRRNGEGIMDEDVDTESRAMEREETGEPINAEHPSDAEHYRTSMLLSILMENE